MHPFGHFSIRINVEDFAHRSAMSPCDNPRLVDGASIVKPRESALGHSLSPETAYRRTGPGTSVLLPKEQSTPISSGDSQSNPTSQIASTETDDDPS